MEPYRSDRAAVDSAPNISLVCWAGYLFAAEESALVEDMLLLLLICFRAIAEVFVSVLHWLDSAMTLQNCHTLEIDSNRFTPIEHNL